MSLSDADKKIITQAAELFVFVILVGALIDDMDLRITLIQDRYGETCKN